MEQIRLTTIIKQIKEGKSIDDCGIVVSNYLPIAEKIYAINGYQDEAEGIDIKGMVDGCIKIVDGVMVEDMISRQIAFIVNVVQLYTNVDLDDDSDDHNVFDLIQEYGIYKYVVNQSIEYDVYEFETMLDSEITNCIKVKNDPLVIFIRFLNEIKEKVPSEKVMKNLLKKMEKLDLSKFTELKELYNFVKKK